jgi:F0F1-type ATP synthase assembly protein I
MRKHLPMALLILLLVSFIGAGTMNIRHTNQKLQFNKIQLKSKEAKLIELNLKYDEVINLKTKSDQERQEQLRRIEELEAQKEALERDLQAKRLKDRLEQQKLASASKRAVGVSSASASSCEVVRSIMSSKGFSGAELDAAVELARVESGCRTNNNNPSSGACNYFQEYPCGKWGGNSNTEAHINGAIGYMQASYGSWQNALRVWRTRSPHWW